MNTAQSKEPLYNFKDLIVWQKSMLLVGEIYKMCNKLPKDESFGLVSQIKRSAVSIPSNVAEGFKRRNKQEFIQFLAIALGSAAELETQLILVSNIFNIKTTDLVQSLEEVDKMLVGLTKATRNRKS